MVTKKTLGRQITNLRRRVGDLEESAPTKVALDALRHRVESNNQKSADGQNGRNTTQIISLIFNAVENWEISTQERLDSGDLLVLTRLKHKALGSEPLTKKDTRIASSILKKYDSKAADSVKSQLRRAA